jgi:hypothetical protein
MIIENAPEVSADANPSLDQRIINANEPSEGNNRPTLPYCVSAILAWCVSVLCDRSGNLCEALPCPPHFQRIWRKKSLQQVGVLKHELIIRDHLQGGLRNE